MPRPLFVSPFKLTNMARSSLAGAHSPLRGKLGNVIYQVTRNAQGKTTQLSKAAETSRENPNTEKQAKARMVMGMIQRMFNKLPQIIKDAYIDTPRGTLSFQHFAKINYEQLRRERDEHWDEVGAFDWRNKYDMLAPAGTWYLTKGDYHSLTYDRYEVQLVDSNPLLLMWDDVSDCITLGDFLKKATIDFTDELWLIYFIQMQPSLVPEVKVAKFRFNEDNSPLTLFEDVYWEEVLLQFEGDPITFNAFMWGDNEMNFSFSDFSDERYVVANAAIMLVNRQGGKTRFSTAKFQWMINPVNPLYGRWYRIQTPAEAFLTWYP